MEPIELLPQALQFTTAVRDTPELVEEMFKEVTDWSQMAVILATLLSMTFERWEDDVGAIPDEIYCEFCVHVARKALSP